MERWKAMLKKLGITGLILAAVAAVAAPQVASAQDRDDYRYSRESQERRGWQDSRADREWREHERRDNREYRTEYRENRRDDDRGYYRNGFYDRFGYWHPDGR
jgi:Ni/Co efflux regulator RcnB